MKVCLVSALTASDFIDSELTIRAAGRLSAPQLGVLSLASILRDKELSLQLVDMDQLFLDFVVRRQAQEAPDSFLTFVVEHLESLYFNVIGFSSICSSYPLTLRLAREVKQMRPSAKIILGGPQASLVDVATLREFPFVDAIVRGEAEATLPLLVNAISGRNSSIDLEAIPGISFKRHHDVIRNPDAPVIRDLDSLPLPAYDLDPHIRERQSVHLEAGRGCPYACTFCSTSGFFGRAFRLKSTGRIIEQMKYLRRTYGTTNYSLVHDIFTGDRRRTVEFCEGLLNCGENFAWGCSARTDRVDDDLIALMAKAGCEGIFFGVETGSTRLQQIIRKNLNLSDALDRIRCADRYGIKTAVALITGFPNETIEDLRDTIHYFVDSCRFDNVEPQLSLLAPLAGTPIQVQYRHSLTLDYIFSDMCHQGWCQDAADTEMIRAHPDAFPNFYAVPTSELERSYFKEVQEFVTAVTTWFRWLPVALLQDSGDFLHMFDTWKLWKSQNPSNESGSGDSKAPYYSRRQFPQEFEEFVRRRYLRRMARAEGAIRTLASEWSSGPMGYQSQPESLQEYGDFRLTSFACHPAGLHVTWFNQDYQALLESLRNKRDLQEVPARNVAVAFRIFRTDGEYEAEVRQLTPLAAELLRMCDGTRTVAEILDIFFELKGVVRGIPANKVAIFGLQQLLKQQLICFSPWPVKERQATHTGPK